MNLISLTRFFSTIIFITVFGLQGCYEQTIPGANDAITGNGETPGQSSGHAGSSTVHDRVKVSLQPMSATVQPEERFTLNVSASGNRTLRYQWRKNGRAIPNAVGSSYTVNKASKVHEGRYDVVIRSGRRSVVSRAATITLESDRSASLSWAPPAKRADGSPLSEEEIAAYRIYHSNDDGSIGRDYEVDPDQQRFELSDLPRGAHHFAIATVDINGMESTLSAVVTKRIL